MPFKKGVSGNPSGKHSKKAVFIREAFKRVVNKHAATELVKQALEQAAEGNPRLLAVIMPYCEQALPRITSHSGPNDGPIEIEVGMP